MIDAHIHLWRFDPNEFAWIEHGSVIARDFLMGDLVADLESSGIKRCVAVQARQSERETDWLAALASSGSPIAGVVGWTDLRSDGIEQRLAQRSAAIVGYRHVVQDEPDDHFLLAPDFIKGVRAVLAQSLTYDLLVGRHQFADVPAFLDSVGDGHIVLDHAAKPNIAAESWEPWATQLANAAAYPGLFCKISGLVTEARHDGWRPRDIEHYLSHILDCFGPERIIWGSDWPVCRLAARYSEVLELIGGFVERHCHGARDAIFGGNAARAYRLAL